MSQIKALAEVVSGECLLPHSLVAAFSLCPQVAEEVNELWRVHYSHHGSSSPVPDCLQKPLCPNFIVYAIIFQHMNFVGTLTLRPHKCFLLPFSCLLWV